MILSWMLENKYETPGSETQAFTTRGTASIMSISKVVSFPLSLQVSQGHHGRLRWMPIHGVGCVPGGEIT